MQQFRLTNSALVAAVLLLSGAARRCDAVGGQILENEEFKNEAECGILRTSSVNRSADEKQGVSGEADTKYEFPWMVSIYATLNGRQECALTDSDCWDFICIGSLINPKVVLTAGEYVYRHQQDKLKARAGEKHQNTAELPYHERFIGKTVFHPLYNHEMMPDELIYDAALLILESPYSSADNIGFICLPPPDLNVILTSCKAAAFKKQQYEHSDYPKLVDFNYVNRDQCQSLLEENWDSTFVLHESFMCTGADLSNDTFRVIGGSPLLCFAEDHYYARSFVSWYFSNGADANTVVVYTDVLKVRNWIDEEMNANGFTTNTYTHVAHRNSPATK